MADGRTSRFEVRLVRADERRAALDVFLGSLHARPTTMTNWSVLSESVEAADTYAAFAGETLIGMCNTFRTDVVVPGGKRLPATAIGRFGVRADQTRRGVGRRLMTATLAGSSTPVMLLRASEGGLYRRFGFGVSTQVCDVTVDARRAVVNPEVPDEGDVRLLAGPAVPSVVDRIYADARDRPGSIARPSYYNRLYEHEASSAGLNVAVAVHRGPAGDDGYARYQVRRVGGVDRPASTVLEVEEMHTRSRQAWAALWRYLVGVPLIDQVTARNRPLDEPVHLLFTDPRISRVEAVTDELWLRLTDVLTALRAREYAGGDDLVLEVMDPLLESNRGTYRVSPDGVHPSEDAADLSLGVDALAGVYLGDTRISTLAAAGRVVIHSEKAVAVADQLFATGAPPWCGTYL